MDFGINFMTRGPLATPQALTAIAKHAEALGYAYITANDHLIVPGTIESPYPYTETGAWGGSDSGACWEHITTLGYVAAHTTTIRLLTSVMVVPYRNAVLAAKTLATVDLLSEGRLTVGCGAGWMREEFEALDAPPFEKRGAVTDEYIQAFRELWTASEPQFDGTYTHFSNVKFEPKTVQKPHPPIWVGGESAPAMRRAARLGDGWYPVSRNPRFPLDTTDRYGSAVARLLQLAEAEDRDPAAIDLAYLVIWLPEPTAQEGPDGRRVFTGGAEQVIEDVQAFAAHGLNHLILSFQTSDLNDTLDRMAQFAETVMAQCN